MDIKRTKERPVIMREVTCYDKMIIGRIGGKPYILTKLEDDLVDKIREGFKNVTELKPTFSVRINGRLVVSDDIVVYGDSMEDVFMDGRVAYMQPQVENKLRDIITHHASLTIPTPIDLEKGLVGNKLNTAATIGQAYLYYLLLVGVPKNIIIYRE